MGMVASQADCGLARGGGSAGSGSSPREPEQASPSLSAGMERRLPWCATLGTTIDIKKRPDLNFRAALQDNPPSSGCRHRSGMVPGLFRHGRGRISSPSFGNGDRRRPDPNVQRRVSPKALGLVQLPCASGWSHRESGQRAARMAIVIHKPRTRSSGAR